MANQPTEVDATRSSRRSLIKKAAATGAVAWTAPLIIDGVTNPAAAATCVANGQYLVAYTENLQQRSLLTAAQNTCNNQIGAVAVSAATVGLTAEWTETGGGANSLAHDGTVVTTAQPWVNGNHRAVKLTITGCNCVIQSVWAHVHHRWDGTCPTPACQPAGAIFLGGGWGLMVPPLYIVAGGLGTDTVTVRPNFDVDVCPFPAGGQVWQTSNWGTRQTWTDRIHWGNPATVTEGTFTTAVYDGPLPIPNSFARFSSGYMVVRCSCS